MLQIQQQHSLIGKREENQDALLVKEYDNGDMLLAVADGMGGGVMGTVLAQKAIEMLGTLFSSSIEYPQTKLDKAIYAINDVLLDMLEGQKGGTTLCVVYYVHHVKKIHYINVGDSRLSVCVEGGLKSITLDQNMYELKKLQNDYAEKEDNRYVYRILGSSTQFELEELFNDAQWTSIGEYDLLINETILLSTDGFHDYMEESMHCKTLEDRFEETLSYVKEHSQDNITYIIAKEI